MGYEWKKIEQNVADNISRLDWTGLGLSVEHALECKYRFWNYFWDEIIICSRKNDHFRPIILAFSSAVLEGYKCKQINKSSILFI